jgi:hypothetical protein
MTKMTGIKDAQYLAQFLGKKIAIHVGGNVGKNSYWIYPSMESIHANGSIVVKDKEGRLFGYSWEDCENPYVLLTNSNIEWEMK